MITSTFFHNMQNIEVINTSYDFNMIDKARKKLEKTKAKNEKRQ